MSYKQPASRFDAVERACDAAHEDYRKSGDNYPRGHYAIVNALLIVASEIACLHDSLCEKWASEQIHAREKTQ